MSPLKKWKIESNILGLASLVLVNCEDYNVVVSQLFQKSLQTIARRRLVTDDPFSHELFLAFRSVRFHQGDWEPQLDIIAVQSCVSKTARFP
jgi:hypothetical protein